MDYFSKRNFSKLKLYAPWWWW